MNHPVAFGIISVISVLYAIYLVNDLLKVLATSLVSIRDYGALRYTINATWIELAKRMFVLLTIPAMMTFFSMEYSSHDIHSSFLGLLIDSAFYIAYGLAIWIYLLFPANPNVLISELKQRGALPKDSKLVNRGYMRIVLSKLSETRYILLTYFAAIVVTVLMIYKVVNIDI